MRTNTGTIQHPCWASSSSSSSTSGRATAKTTAATTQQEEDCRHHHGVAVAVVVVEDVQHKMHFLTGMAAIGGFLFGYDTGVISGALLPLQRAFDLSAQQQEVVVSSTVLAAFFSSLLVGSRLNATAGRKKAILSAATIFCIGSLLLALAWNYTSLVVARIVVGIGIGIASLTTPLYIAEAAIPAMRGQMVTVNALMVTTGQFIAGMVDGVFDQIMPVTGWRVMLGLAFIPSFIMLLGFWKLPESPRWLAAKGRISEAEKVLRSLRETDQQADEELRDILASILEDEDDGDGVEYGATTTEIVQQQHQQESTTRTRQISFSKTFYNMLLDAPTRRALTTGCGLMVIQQSSGINTVMYYAASIYEMSQFEEITAVWLSGFTALAQVVGIGISIYLVDRMGRRTLVLLSLFFVTISLFFLGLSFYLARVKSEPVIRAFDSCQSQPSLGFIWDGMTRYCYDCVSMEHCGFCSGHCTLGTPAGPLDPNMCPPAEYDGNVNNDNNNNDSNWIFGACKNPFGFMSAFFMVAYLLSFGIGMGGMPWTINSEIYPLRYRSMAVSCSTATNWIGNLIVAATFLSISSPNALTAYGAFWLYGWIALVGCIWLYFTLPETKGLTLEEIEQLFHRAGDSYDVLEGIEYEQTHLIHHHPAAVSGSQYNDEDPLSDCEESE